MNMKYRVVFVVVFLLLSLSVSLSSINYYISLENTQERLKNRSLPLSTDNIYTEIQKHIIEPNLVASMMAEDTFLKEWLVNSEHNQEDIKKYLSAIKNRYGMFMTFLASDKTKNYYTSKGFIEKMKEDNPTNKWYYSFMDSTSKNEINLDYNKNIDNSMLMFINHKIFDKNYNIIGATGVGFKTSYIDNMLKKFRINYMFKVYFIDKNGELILYERTLEDLTSENEPDILLEYKDEVLNKKNGILKVDIDSQEYLVNVKYIEELDLYLIVEAKVSNFTTDVERVFFMNLSASILVTLFVVLMILRTVYNYNKKLEHMANHDALTNLPNRRKFNYDFKKLVLLHSRQKNDISLLFFDIDNFKKINDEFGHQVGDDVLKRISEIIRGSVRQTDLIARWGGEEFIIAFIDSSLDDSKLTAEKLRGLFETDSKLTELVGAKVTASFGLTNVSSHDKIFDALKHVDDAMYKAKEDGKNRIVIS